MQIKKQPIQSEVYLGMFILNLFLTAFFLYIDEGNYSFQEFQHPYTWVYWIVVASIFTITGLVIYSIFDRVFKLPTISQFLFSWVLIIPSVLFIISGITFVIRLLN